MAKLITADGQILITIGDIVGDTSIDGDLTVVNVTATGNLNINTGATEIQMVFQDTQVPNRFQFTDGGNSLDSYFNVVADSTRAAYVTTTSGTVFNQVTSGFGRNGFQFGGADFYLRSSGKSIFRVSQSAADGAMYLDGSSKLLIGTTTAGASKLRVNDDSIEIMTAKTPASASATGTTGQIAWDSGYFYVCVATDTWQRVAHATWA